MKNVGVEKSPEGLLRAFRSFVIAVDSVSRVALFICLSAIVIITSLQVVMRYGFNHSIDSADETARLFFVWSIFLGIPHGVRYGVHVGIDLLPNMLSARSEAILFRVMCAFSAGLMGVVAYAAIGAVGNKWQEFMPTLNVSTGVFYIAVLIAAAHSTLHLILCSWGGRDIWLDIDGKRGISGADE